MADMEVPADAGTSNIIDLANRRPDSLAPRQAAEGGERAARVKRRFAGGVLALLALFCIAVEIARNYDFGAAQSPVVGATLAAFAAAIGVISILEAERGRTLVSAFAMLVCWSVTFWAGVSFYGEKLDAKAKAAQRELTRYADARQVIEAARAEAEAARAEAARNPERAPSTELQRLYEDAKTRQAAEAAASRGGCGQRCRTAEQDAAGVLARISAARAREEAEARARAADARVEAGRADASHDAAPENVLSLMVAERLGVAPRDIDFAFSIVIVLGMLAFASMLGPALDLIADDSGPARADGMARPKKPRLDAVQSARDIEAADPATTDGPAMLSPQERHAALFVAERIQRSAAKRIAVSQLKAAFADWLEAHPAVNDAGDRIIQPGDHDLRKAMNAAGYCNAKKAGVSVHLDCRFLGA